MERVDIVVDDLAPGTAFVMALGMRGPGDSIHGGVVRNF